MLVTTKLLSSKKYLGMTNIILLQQKFCHGNHTFVVTKDTFVAPKTSVTAKWCLWQLLPMISNQFTLPLFSFQHCLQYSVFTLSVPALCSELCCFYSFSPSTAFSTLFLLFQSQRCVQSSALTLSVPALCSELYFNSFSPSTVFRALL